MWSFTSPSFTRMVRRLSPLCPLPTCFFLSAEMLPCLRSLSAANSLAVRIARAMSLFRFCERSSSQRTVRPVGICLRMTQVSSLLAFCPPFPPERVVEYSRSLGDTENSYGCGSVKVATVTVEVWTRPLRSVGGILCHLWPPDSLANTFSVFLPVTRNTTIPGLSSVSSTSKTPPLRKFRVDSELVDHQQFGVHSSLSSPNFDYHFISPVRGRIKTREAPFLRPSRGLVQGHYVRRHD